jgi:hypothetical protein
MCPSIKLMPLLKYWVAFESMANKGKFTLMINVGKNVGDIEMRLPHPYLPWPPWAIQHMEKLPYLCHINQGGNGK